MPMAEIAQKGMLIQKIQRHVDFSANVPPKIGPMTVPTAHCPLMTDIHLPRSRSVTMSVSST
jgi:hypothetical protein